MRLLLIADVHLDTPFTWAGPEVARHRRRAIRSALERAVAVAAERDADAFLVAGDLYEQELFAPDTSAFLRNLFGSTDMRIFIAPGNHDWYGPQSIYQQEAWTPNVHVFSEDRLAPVELADGLTLWGAAHRAPANTDGFLDGFVVDRDGIHLALFHGSEQGAFTWQESGKVAHAPFHAEQIPAAGLHHALVGHFHAPQLADWHTYPGNPDPLAFGETGFRGAVLVEVMADGSVQRESIPVASSTVHDLTVDLTGTTNANEAIQRVSAEIAGLSGCVRATLTGEISPEVDIQVSDFRPLGAHLDAFVPRVGRLTVSYDFDALMVEATVRGQFTRDVLASDLDEETQRRVLITGLRALDGRANDLEVH